LKINPYYLHHPDQVLGAMHFYLSLEEGRRIFAPLRDLLPGWATPQYVIDIPGGEGKSNAFNPEQFSFSGKLLNRRGEIIAL
jgi:lysine 2,3-aminomutase